MPLSDDDVRTMHSAVAEFRKSNEKMLEEVRRYGQASGESKAQVEKMQTFLDNLEKKYTSRMNDLEGIISRKGHHVAGGDDPVVTEHKRMFFAALRGGKHAPSAEELQVKGLIEGSDPSGGFLAPSEYVREILKDSTEFSPIRSVARNMQISSAGVSIPKRTQTAAATWTSELGTRTETTNPTFGIESVPVHELHGMCRVSKQLVEDSVFDLEGFLRAEFSEQFGLSEGMAFVRGNAVGKPEGILTNPDVAFVANGHASVLQADGIIAILYDLKEVYSNNAIFAMNRNTLKTVRQLKDGVGRYIWEPSFQVGEPPKILGRPYILCPDLDDVTPDSFPLLCGDFRRGYLVLDRVSMEVIVDPFSSKTTGQVEFSARRRVGGGVILASAIRKLKIAAS